MLTVGFIAPPNTYNHTYRVRKLLGKLKENYPLNVLIVSGGNDTGMELDVKEISLSLNMLYKEFNPTFTLRNEYSYMSDSFFGKKYHYTHIFDRYKVMFRYCDKLVFGMDEGSAFDPNYLKVLKDFKKKLILFT